ncbi:MAG: GAF domain-containing sensor histidine kinase [Anaerolineae bacterium]|jgi:signal transduction histidine kinase|nr:GAF domain-containing sensor histidine kinase [Anaerolineae bacterium]
MALQITDLNEMQILVENYRRIIEISRQLNSTLEHRSLLQQIISAVTEILQTEAASILLIDPITGELKFEIASNINPHAMETIIVPMEGSIAGWIATHGEPRVIQDVTQEPGHFQAVDDTIAFKTRNLLGVPLRTHKKVIGVIQAVNKQGSEKFTEADVNTLTILASQAAIAIENARLFRQSDFIAEMVHELRTPLAGLKASTTLLMRPTLPEEKRTDIINLIQSETDRLIRLTTEFLDLAQLESGRTRLEITKFELTRFIEESIEVLRPQAQEKGISIELEGPSMVVAGDRGKLKQVLLNLLTNAIKYNRPHGKIFLRWQLDGDFVHLQVVDTGYGISKENQKQMFQKFFRVADTAGFTQGTGLGLVITKHIIEAHGGEIWLESEEGVGTSFHFTLPMK